MRINNLLLQICIILTLEFVSTGKIVYLFPENPVGIIKIGLLVQDSSYFSAIQGAELAILEANKEGGGPDGRKFGLVVRSMEGPWGTGSKQAVNLIFEEKVWALLGVHDGRNAHLVEQAATKSQVVFLSAWSADPTLSQAFVPWFFNCVPNDNQQAESLAAEIYTNRKFNRIVFISGDDYDSKITANSFLKLVNKPGKPSPIVFSFRDYTSDLNDLSDKIIKADAECLVLFCKPGEALSITRHCMQKGINLPIFGPLMILNEDELTMNELEIYDNILSVPAGNWRGPGYISFRQKFQNLYKRNPGTAASFSYDAMNLLIEAVRKAGKQDRELIQKSLKNIQYSGVTGLIKFDDKGNRLGEFEVRKTKNGVPSFPD